MASIIVQLSGYSHIAISKAPAVFYFNLQYTSGTFSLSPGVTSISTSLDRVNLITIPSVFSSYYNVTPYIDVNSIASQSFSYYSSDTNVATVSGNGLYYKSNGTAFMIVSGVSVLNDSFVVNSTTFSFASGTGGNQSVSVYLSAAPNTTRLDATSSVDMRLFNKSATTAKNIFTTQNHSLSTYVRNVNCWAYDIDLSPISPWNSLGANTRAGTLITPRHIVFAAHYQLSVGSYVRFITSDNQMVQRMLIGTKTHPGYTPYFPDLTIGVLGEDVPSNIKTCKVLPDNWLTYLPTNITSVPALILDQEEKALVADGSNISSTLTSFSKPIDSKRLEFYEDLVGGDSGNPSFIIINSQLVLLAVWTYGGPGVGTSITYQKASLNQMIKDLDTSVGINTGYSLTEIDLSRFRQFN